MAQNGDLGFMKRFIQFAIFICIGLLFCNLTLFAQQSPEQENPTQVSPTPNPLTAKLSGEVVWQGFDLSQTNVSVYRDEKLKELYTSGLSSSGTGQFTLRVAPGTYYLVAYVDVDRSGKFDEGDGYGVLGIQDWQDASQKHKAVTISDKGDLKGIKIPITARLQRMENEEKLVAATLYQPSEYQKFKTELTRATSGCRGTLIDIKEPNLTNVKRLILAYTDTSWKFRAGITEVDSRTGKWELRLKPGKYYLMAIVDKNNSNRLDAGDTFGFYGVINLRKRGAFPEPVLVKPAAFTEDLEIQITATYAEKGQPDNKKKTAIVSGRVLPVPEAGIEVRVEVYTTSALVNPVASAVTDSEGQYRFKLPVGEYYIIANQDTDGNGRYSEGDSLGGFGTISIAANPPKSIKIVEGETRGVYVYLSARYDVNGQLVAMSESGSNRTYSGIGPNTTNGNVSETNTTDEQTGRITGKITSFFSTRTTKVDQGDAVAENEEPVPNGILSLSTTPEFDSPMLMPLFLDDDNRFVVDVEPGVYYVLAVVDQNSDGLSGTSDGIGVYGTHLPVRGTPAAITVFPGKTTPHVDIDILATYVDEKGTMAELSDGGRWNIARMYGEPEDIFKYTRNGRLVEEWMYWSRGLGFHFEADGAGWKLSDKNEFKPNIQNLAKETNKTEEQLPEENTQQTEPVKDMNIEGFSIAAESVNIYYSHEGVLWRIAPGTRTISADGNTPNEPPTIKVDTRVAPLGPGYRPSASATGTLVFHDFDDNVIIRDITTGVSKVLLDNRHLAQDVAISPDGEFIAYVQTSPTRRKRIFIQNLRSERLFHLPSTAIEMSNPAWRIDGQMLAYAAAGSIENPKADENRNIYAFDNAARSIEPIVISSSDDAEPAWHPSDLNTLAFSRGTDGNSRQIWVVTYSSTGEPSEQQITEMGGNRPIWVPPDGRWIIYENNGQLWTVDTQTPRSESPLISNGKAVFGYQPIAVPVR